MDSSLQDNVQNAMKMFEQKSKEYENQAFENSKTSKEKEMYKLNNNVEDDMAKNQKESEKKSEENAKSSIQSIAENSQLSLDQINQKEEKDNKEISLHSEEGDVYVNMQSSVSSNSTQASKNGINSKASEDLNNEQEKQAQAIGQEKGINKAQEHNKKIQEETKQEYMTIKTNETASSNLAFSALQKVKLQIMSLIGVNIPL